MIMYLRERERKILQALSLLSARGMGGGGGGGEGEGEGVYEKSGGMEGGKEEQNRGALRSLQPLSYIYLFIYLFIKLLLSFIKHVIPLRCHRLFK